MAGALAALAIVTAAYEVWLGVSNPTVVGLSYLLVVLLVAAVSTLRVAFATSVLALLALNYFFMPPVGTFRLEDPQNWVALLVFLTVSVVATVCPLMARSRADEALDRRDELGRLFDLSRDILLTTDSRDVIDELARHMARRFGFDYVGICLPGPERMARARVERRGDAAGTGARQGPRQGARRPRVRRAPPAATAGIWCPTLPDGMAVTLVPLRLGMRAVGLLAAAGRPVEPGTLDAIAGLTAIAIERAKMLEERRDAERVRQGAELKTALLASLGHDLKTPLTAIAAAAGNLRAPGTSDAVRRDQLDVIGLEVTRLNRLFQNIIDMARIETGAIAAEPEWVHPADIVDAAVQQVEHALQNHPLELDVDTPESAKVDPRLTSTALAHLLENAGQYAAAGTPISVTAKTDEDGLTLSVRDRGPGIAAQDLEHLFEQFYRGAGARHRSFGTGMGLAITRGLLAAEGGRVWAENHPEGGASFTLNIPTPVRQEDRAGEASS